MPQESRGTPWANTDAPYGTGEYLYCVVDSPETAILGRIGLGGASVYTKSYRDICAVVHCGAGGPYQSNDQQVVREWMLTHHRVVEAAWGRYGTVLPSNFNNIFQGGDNGDMGRKIEEWLEAEHHNLRAKTERVMDRAEYGAHVSWAPAVISRSLAQSNRELAGLKAEITSKLGGTAFSHRERLKDLLRGDLERETTTRVQDFYARIRKQVDDLRVERTKRLGSGRHMVMNISCLATREQAIGLGRVLDDIGKMKGFFVGFTGPWPPYSFVGNPW